ncbi:MAG: PEP-CTERM sorting domain-containing protein [Deltaproteobacteria bacterium]
MEVRDLDVQQCSGGDGCWTPVQASFDADSRLQAYSTDYWNSDETYYSFWDESWSTESNISPADFSDDWAEDSRSIQGYFTTEHVFHTGPLTLEFEAVVGHMMDIEASLFTYAAANFEAEGVADFSHTFSLTGLTAPGNSGLQFDWQIPPQPTQPTPEPASLLLFGAGLGGLLCLRRKGKGYMYLRQ